MHHWINFYVLLIFSSYKLDILKRANQLDLPFLNFMVNMILLPIDVSLLYIRRLHRYTVLMFNIETCCHVFAYSM